MPVLFTHLSELCVMVGGFRWKMPMLFMHLSELCVMVCGFRWKIPILFTHLNELCVMIGGFRWKMPGLFTHLDALRLHWSLVGMKWFICLFADVLPVEVSVWNCGVVFRVCVF